MNAFLIVSLNYNMGGFSKICFPTNSSAVIARDLIVFVSKMSTPWLCIKHLCSFIQHVQWLPCFWEIAFSNSASLDDRLLIWCWMLASSALSSATVPSVCIWVWGKAEVWDKGFWMGVLTYFPVYEAYLLKTFSQACSPLPWVSIGNKILSSLSVAW